MYKEFHPITFRDSPMCVWRYCSILSLILTIKLLWVVNATSQPFLSWGRPSAQLYRCVCGPSVVLDCCGKFCPTSSDAVPSRP